MIDAVLTAFFESRYFETAKIIIKCFTNLPKFCKTPATTFFSKINLNIYGV